MSLRNSTSSTASSTTTSIMDDPPFDMPAWLATTSANRSVERFPTTKAAREMQRAMYEVIFESLIDYIQSGHYLSDFFNTYPREVNRGDLMRWIMKDATRRERYEEAQEICGEFLMDDARKRAVMGENNGIPEDVNRSQLAVSTLMKQSSFYNRKRYGDKVQVDQNIISIDFTAAERRAEQLMERRRNEKVIDGERLRDEQ